MGQKPTLAKEGANVDFSRLDLCRPLRARICAETLPISRACTWRGSTRTIIRSIRTPWTGPGTHALNFTVRQENGTFNALGAVKIDMANSYSVYMHDTNQRSLFSDDYRFDSHGCSRVDNVRNLADWLLYEEMPKWNRAGVDAAIATGAREEVTLPKKVPVACIDLTAWMTRDQSSSATTSMPRTSSFWKRPPRKPPSSIRPPIIH